MTRLARLRSVIAGDVFARVVVLLLFAWLLIVWTAWQHAETRADQLQRVTDADGRRWQVIVDRCTTNSAGGLACPDGVLTTTTSTTVTP